MEWLVWIGAGVSAIGLLGVVYTMIAVRAARKAAAGDDEALRLKLSKIIPLNLGAFMLSMFGLMMVVIGVILAP